jgi:hypothetical protein
LRNKERREEMKALKGLMATRCGIGSYMLMLVFLLSFGCATAPPGQPVDWASETKDRLEQADIYYSILLRSFQAFRAEEVLIPAICTAGEGMATEWDAKFAIAQDLITQFQAGKIGAATAKKSRGRLSSWVTGDGDCREPGGAGIRAFPRMRISQTYSVSRKA